MKTEMLDLVNQYLGAARACAEALAKQFDNVDILSAVNSLGMPRGGAITAFGGGSYFVHGTGCCVTAAQVEIDFDLGPNGSIPGFDPWKLYDFAQARRENYPWLPDRKTFEQEVKKLVADGHLKRSGTEPNPQLLSPSKLRSVGSG